MAFVGGECIADIYGASSRTIALEDILGTAASQEVFVDTDEEDEWYIKIFLNVIMRMKFEGGDAN